MTTGQKWLHVVYIIILILILSELVKIKLYLVNIDSNIALITQNTPALK